jgi:hypothetical protein
VASRFSNFVFLFLHIHLLLQLQLCRKGGQNGWN